MLNLPQLYCDLYVVIESLYKSNAIEDKKIDLLRRQLEAVGAQMNALQHSEFASLLLKHKKLEMLHEPDEVDFSNYEVGSGGSSSRK